MNTQEEATAVEEPRAGEWWLLTTSGGWVAEQEQLLLRLPNGSWLTRNGWRGAFYIQHPDKLICRVPTRFPRLRKLRDKLRFFFQKISR